MRVFVEAVGLCGPGLAGWGASRPVLAGKVAYEPGATVVPATPLLPPNERRRAVPTVRLILAVGAEAFAMAACDAATTRTVFTSSGGDGDTIHEILKTIASPNPEVSPTRFHNSVHNAPAGYWSIATGSRAPSTSLCCYDDSFAAGLLEAVVTATTELCPVAVVAYDVQYPEPLASMRAIGAPFAVALVLSAEPTKTAFAFIDLTLGPQKTPPTPATVLELERLRCNTPAARALPLLQALARDGTADIVLPYLAEMELLLTVGPVSTTADAPVHSWSAAAQR
jgi:hypothetical protein